MKKIISIVIIGIFLLSLVIAGDVTKPVTEINLDSSVLDILESKTGEKGIKMTASEIECDSKTCYTEIKKEGLIRIVFETKSMECNEDNSSCKAFTEEEIKAKRDEYVNEMLKTKAVDIERENKEAKTTLVLEEEISLK